MNNVMYLTLITMLVSCGESHPCEWNAQQNTSVPLSKNEIDCGENPSLFVDFYGDPDRGITLSLGVSSEGPGSLGSFNVLIPNDQTSGTVNYTNDEDAFRFKFFGLEKPSIANVSFTRTLSSPFNDIPASEIEEDKVYEMQLNLTVNLETMIVRHPNDNNLCDGKPIVFENFKIEIKSQGKVEFCEEELPLPRIGH